MKKPDKCAVKSELMTSHQLSAGCQSNVRRSAAWNNCQNNDGKICHCKTYYIHNFVMIWLLERNCFNIGQLKRRHSGIFPGLPDGSLTLLTKPKEPFGLQWFWRLWMSPSLCTVTMDTGVTLLSSTDWLTSVNPVSISKLWTESHSL